MNQLPCSSLFIPSGLWTFPLSQALNGTFFSIDSPKGEDLILGYEFLYSFNPIIDWKNGTITSSSSHKDSSGINSSTSNELATAVNSVYLVGKLKTPSLPSYPISHCFHQEMKSSKR
ncbi:hypothetical protein O181_035530 [Austropuccinia psidii MF-1]|uniref:Uncharacterized protein n=1 Tax=Austropuccinia psidii MF-1 TaxID=1389203 RepID=A0A9Q3D723_9BASI|nr:hypothetical protein [Austropuccinia psidii MF-1]